MPYLFLLISSYHKIDSVRFDCPLVENPCNTLLLGHSPLTVSKLLPLPYHALVLKGTTVFRSRSYWFKKPLIGGGSYLPCRETCKYHLIFLNTIDPGFRRRQKGELLFHRKSNFLLRAIWHRTSRKASSGAARLRTRLRLARKLCEPSTGG